MNSKFIIRLKRLQFSSPTPVYAIVVARKKQACSGSYLNRIGFYDPKLASKKLFIDYDNLSLWLLRGATLSRRAFTLLAYLLLH